MKKVFAGFILVLIALYMGIFTVRDNQVGMVTNKYNKQLVMYTAGLHFMVPYLETVQYIDTGALSNLLTMQVTLKNVDSSLSVQDYKVSFMINWHISVSTNYYKYVVLNSENGAISKIRQLVKNYINNKAIEYTTLDEFDSVENFITEPFFISNPGIVIDSIRLVQVVPVHNKNIVKTDIESQIIIAQNKDAMSESIQNMEEYKQIESAYYLAHNIVAQTVAAKAEIYNGLNKKDQKFYEYYRALQVYKDTAQSKDDLPPLSKLYPDNN